MEAVSSWKIVASYYTEDGDSCEHCGHAIKEVFVITNGTVTMNVGSDCVVNLVSPLERSASELITKRMSRAASQFRKNEPAAKQGETRTEYINRRVAEMANAFKAYNVWVTYSVKQRTNPKRWQFSGKVATRFLCSIGIVEPKVSTAEYEESLRYSFLWHEIVTAYDKKASKRLFAKIDKLCGSNSYDYVNHSITKIRKL